MNNEIKQNVQSSDEEVHYSSFRYALGALLAFFGFSSKTHHASQKRAKLVGVGSAFGMKSSGSAYICKPPIMEPPIPTG